MHGARSRRALAASAAALLSIGLVSPALSATLRGTTRGTGRASSCSAADWPTFGHDVAHSFDVAPSCSPITGSNVATLLPAWFFHAKDSITASPAVVDGVLYVGSWDGTFYALDAATGSLHWSFQIRSHARAAFGRIVSSAAVGTFEGRKVVLFGGGSSVWALDAATGAEVDSIDLEPRTAAQVAADSRAGRDPVVEVEASPAIATIDGVKRIYVGLDVHNGKAVGRTGLVALSLSPDAHGQLRFAPLWKYDVETTHTYAGRAGLTVGSGSGWGCGGVWSSPAVDVGTRTVAFGSGSCDFGADALDHHENFEEAMHALDAVTGRLLWRFRPADLLATREAKLADADRDADFGAAPNIFTIAGRRVVGEGRKSADYVVRDLLSGRPVSTTLAGQEGQAQPGFGVGGFLGTPAVGRTSTGATIVVGATAIPIPKDLAGVDRATWAVRGLDPAAGKVLWTYRLAGPSYGHTTIVGGVAFVVDTTTSSVIALSVDTGLPLWIGPVIGPPSSSAVVVGDQLFVGTGTRETDLEYKAFNSTLEDLLASSTGASPLSPFSGVQAFRLAAG